MVLPHVETITLMGREFSKLFNNYRPITKEALETGLIEGVPFRLLDGEIEPGDTYIAERNGMMKLLTCRQNYAEERFIAPVESDYSFDTSECIKIELLID